ncbi:hypothetical protein EVAR_98565_1 [Eumeta japonica]|uniref:Uncharacterized protein n=1 Tax=Eumeta variegata TaxID=151549 RepID=A0A4C1SL38_EUMVA|nr:hypothetical protein EVAR_98565_1 [Eumeta japonica]
MSQSHEIGTLHDRHSLPTYLPIYLFTCLRHVTPYMPGCRSYGAQHRCFVVHGGGRATITKFVTEIDTTALEFCKPVITIRLAWCFIAKSSSKPSDW